MFNKPEGHDMATQAIQSALTVPATFPSLDAINRPAVPTEQAAFYLLRQPQTLRLWACKENGPLRPTRINGRLAWSVAEIRRLLEVQS